jgi:hypothetical protein
MRLIDADELEKNFAVPSNELFYAGTVLEYIKDVPTVDAIPKGAYEQVKWERDMAVQQLNDYGVQLGGKADLQAVVRCNDCNHYSRGVCWNENITSNCDCDLEKEPNGFCDWGERRGD